VSQTRGPLLTTPVAILIGAVVIAFGLYFGLRASSPAGPTATTGATIDAAGAAPGATLDAAAPAGSITSRAPPASASPIRTPAEQAEVREAVARDAKAVLERTRAALKKKCWDPHVKEPAAAPMKLVYSLAFNEDGKMVARGIVEDRATARAEVAQCLRLEPMDLTVPPPGENVSIEVPFELP
jgi:hypothetical protein